MVSIDASLLGEWYGPWTEGPGILGSAGKRSQGRWVGGQRLTHSGNRISYLSWFHARESRCRVNHVVRLRRMAGVPNGDAAGS